MNRKYAFRALAALLSVLAITAGIYFVVAPIYRSANEFFASLGLVVVGVTFMRYALSGKAFDKLGREK